MITSATPMRAPNGMPSTRWVDIAWRVINSVQEDRVLLISAGVTFYGLLALFPAPAALIALFGLFANPVAINDQLAQLSGFLPAGALEIVADQIKRIAAHSGSTLSLAFGFGLIVSLWGANAGQGAEMRSWRSAAMKVMVCQ